MTRRTSLLAAGAVVAVLLLALLFGLSDLSELAARAGALRWGWVAAAAASALLSYACIAFCQRHLLRMLGHDVPAWTMVRAVTVSTVANRSVRSAGATGFALLAWLLSRRGLPASAVLTSTVGFIILTNALFAALFVAAVLVVVASELAGESAGAPVLGGEAILGLVLTAAGFLAALAATWAVLFSARLRSRWMSLARRLVRRAGERWGRSHWDERAGEFLDRFDVAARELLDRRGETGAAWLWSALRILTSLVCLWACARAVGTAPDAGAVLLAYTAAKTTGVVSLIPGGLGLVEGSLAGVLAAFGMPWEAALLTALLNRAVYHFLPTGLALAFFGPLVRRARVAVAASEPPPD